MNSAKKKWFISLYSVWFIPLLITPSLLAAEIDIRIVSASGAITETICELGFGEKIVGVDITSKYPEKLIQQLPKIGHGHSLNAEGILALNPTHVFLMDAKRSNTLVDQLKKAQVIIHEIPYPKKVEGSLRMILAIAKALDVPEKGDALIEKVKKDLRMAQSYAQTFKEKPKVLFVYARGLKTIYVGGTGTLAESLLVEAGGINAISSFASYQQLTAENVIKANPDVFVAFEGGVNSVGGIEGFLNLPGVKLTNAGKHNHIVLLDDSALNFGPRVGKFVLQVSKNLKKIQN
jgi:iron complex transport system substrate-binding protein